MSESFQPVEMRWQTRARRIPRMIAKSRHGNELLFGPYTYLQIGAGLAILLIGHRVMEIWRPFS